MLKLAYYVELTWLLVDMISGYLQNHDIYLPGNQTVSALVRVAVVFLCLGIILRYATPKRLLVWMLLLVCFVWMSVHVVFAGLGGDSSISADAQFHLKLMLPILLYGTLQVQLERQALDATRVRNIVLLNTAVLIFNVSLGLFGIGFGNYGESESGELLGSKGFFFAGNEVSATLVALFALVSFVFRERFRRHSLELVAVVGLFFAVSLMSMSKTSLIGFVLVLLYVAYNDLSRSSKVKFAVFLTTAMLVTAPWWLTLLDGSIERWQYFWEIRADFLDFVTSGRTERIQHYVNWLAGIHTPWPILFGEGHRQGEDVVTFENDLLDLTMGSGVLGLVFYAIWAHWAWAGLSNRLFLKRLEGSFTFYIVSLFILLSIVAGHVIYSATLSPFIALLALSSSQRFPGTSTQPKFSRAQ